MNMRSILPSSITALAIAAIALSSCGTSSRMASTKGFGGGFGEGKPNVASTPAASQPAAESTATPAETPAATTNTPVAGSVASSVSSATTATANSAVASAKTAAKTALDLNKSGKKMSMFKAIRKAKKAMKAKKDVDTGNPLIWILLLILCFVIPPLAYFLIKGTDTMFWICLLCFLIALYGFVLNLAFIAGVISIVIALLALLGS